MPSIPSEKSHSFLVADDHAIVRRGLRQLVAEECAGAVVEEASTGQAVLDAVRRQDWALVFLDINLPDKNGLEVLKDLQALRPACRSLFSATMRKSNMRRAPSRPGQPATSPKTAWPRNCLRRFAKCWPVGGTSVPHLPSG